MGTIGQIPSKALISEVNRERAFRRRIVDIFGGILKSDAPPEFKAFVAILLFLGLSASLVFSVFIFEVLAFLIKSQQHEVHAVIYAGILSGHCLAGVLVGYPVTMRMSALEEAHRLEANLRKIQEIKRGRKPKDHADKPVNN